MQFNTQLLFTCWKHCHLQLKRTRMLRKTPWHPWSPGKTFWDWCHGRLWFWLEGVMHWQQGVRYWYFLECLCDIYIVLQTMMDYCNSWLLRWLYSSVIYLCRYQVCPCGLAGNWNLWAACPRGPSRCWLVCLCQQWPSLPAILLHSQCSSPSFLHWWGHTKDRLKNIE